METPIDLRTAFGSIRTWTRGEQRAPHKPLLLLLALARLQRGEPRLVAFSDIEPVLRRLLVEFGPSRDSYHPEYPFWRLQRDEIWEVPGAEQLRSRESNSDPPVSELRRVSGGFPESVDATLRSTPDLVRELAQEVLQEHFPTSIHDDILAAVGLDLEKPVAPQQRRARDRQFRAAVLNAYGFQCAICGLDTRLDGMAVGLEGAHVMWHCNRGPDAIENGLCLCPLHHKALDLGLVTIGIQTEVLVSARLHGGDMVEAQIGRFHRAPLRGPLHGNPPISETHAAWHRREVFKNPERRT